jgi:homoserine O-acetyltransferase
MRFVFALLLAALPVVAQSGQKFAELRNLRLTSGETIATCRLGYRTTGTLNADKSNAILWPTWFSGTSEQIAPYLGPGKMLDTGRFFVITTDALGNGVSCSPSNQPKPFPAITTRDMVNAQYRMLTEHLGITRLYAVMGISMGGMQTFEWITDYPGFMRKAIPIVGSPRLSTSDLLLWQAELDAIEAVAKAGGDPRGAMPAVLAMHQFALTTPADHVRKSPASDFASLKAKLANDARTGMDPLDWAAQLRAMIQHDITRPFGGSLEKAGAVVKAQVLVVVATQDHMVNPTTALEMAAGSGFQVLRLTGDCGHMAPGCEAGMLNAVVQEFLK